MCHRGLILYCPDLAAEGFSMDDYSRAYRMTVPCMCASGREIIETTYKNSDINGMNDIRAKAQKQRQYYHNLATKEGIKMKKKEQASKKGSE